MKIAVKTDKAPAAIGPYSQAIKASGEMVFVSGQIPLDPATGKMAEGIEAQARQSLTNVKNILEAAGSSLAKAVRVGIFMTDLADFQKVNAVYGSFFEGEAPARATVEVSALPMGALIEIEAIALL